MFSSKSVEWETPDKVFNALNKEFNFTLDPCATDSNAKCSKYYTVSDNGLLKLWKDEVVFCNPPYGRDIKDWIIKAHSERNSAKTIVMLLPSRTDTTWFHSYILKDANEIRFIKGRLKFGTSKNSAPFPSMIVVYHKESKRTFFTKWF